MNHSCVFCANLTSLEILFQDERTAVALHEDWAVRGHAMVIWKSHVENISELTSEEWSHFAGIYRRTERVLLEVTGAERALILKLGIITPHLHVHIYPVRADRTRAEAMDIIEGRVHEGKDAGLVERLRARLDSMSSTE